MGVLRGTQIYNEAGKHFWRGEAQTTDICDTMSETGKYSEQKKPEPNNCLLLLMIYDMMIYDDSYKSQCLVLVGVG